MADSISYIDLEREKKVFNLNKENRDNFYSFKEVRSVPGLVKHNLVKLGDSDSCIANYCMFILFVFLILENFINLI